MHVFPDHILLQAEKVLSAARRKSLRLCTAESCTGGLLSASLTEIAGSSDVFDRGFITYSYGAKTDLLLVNPATLTACGAVSAETALEMARGALKNSDAHIALSVTGIAGPGGGTPDKPVGLVYMATTSASREKTFKNNFKGDRSDIRIATVQAALSAFLEEIENI